MNYPLFHTITFNVLYGCIGILTFVILERGFYIAYISWQMQRLAAIVELSARDAGHAVRSIAWTDPLSRAIVRYAQLIWKGATYHQQEDLSSALFIGIDKKVTARLWILDTVVTAAPLLGLLGTIFGIMQTFNALAAGGVSDSAEVSRGIGTALVATAIGIATALLGLLGNNVLSRRTHVVMEDFKGLLLNLSVGLNVQQKENEASDAGHHAALSMPMLRRGIAD
jgi:biopolymer transport protein ExbB